MRGRVSHCPNSNLVVSVHKDQSLRNLHLVCIVPLCKT